MIGSCLRCTALVFLALLAVAAIAPPAAAQQPSFPGPAAQEVFVAQITKGRDVVSSIDVFSAAASGLATPQKSIKGPAASLGSFSPNCLAIDAAGRIYVAMYGAKAAVFEAGANGNAAVLKYWQTYDIGGMTPDSSGAVEPDGTFYALFNRSPTVGLIPPNAPNRIPKWSPQLRIRPFQPGGVRQRVGC